MTALEKTGKTKGLRVYNEYAQPLTIDAVKLALKEQDLTVISDMQLKHKVQEQVDEVLYDKDIAEWEARRKRAFRDYYAAMWALAAVIMVQVVLFTAGIWLNDWKWGQTGLVLFILDVLAAVTAGFLSDRVPDKDTRPARPRRSYY